MFLSNSTLHWAGHLQRCSGDPALAFDRNGNLTLLAVRHRIDFRIAGEALSINARICNWPCHQNGAEQQAWLQRILMLAANHAPGRQEAPVLTGFNALQLSGRIPAYAGYAAFCLAYDGFTDALAAWRRFLLPISSDAVTLARQTSDQRFADAPFNIQPSPL